MDRKQGYVRTGETVETSYIGRRRQLDCLRDEKVHIRCLIHQQDL